MLSFPCPVSLSERILLHLGSIHTTTTTTTTTTITTTTTTATMIYNKTIKKIM